MDGGGGAVGGLVCLCFFWEGGGVVFSILRSRHTEWRPVQARWLYLFTSSTLPLILLWFCSCLCSIGALEAGSL